MIPRALLIISLVLGIGCEKTNHENIDKWTRTEKGPGKLEKTLKDEGLDADLSAHAAANMIRMGNDPAVRTAFDQMSEARQKTCRRCTTGLPPGLLRSRLRHPLRRRHPSLSLIHI
mgnify:CR=1 FL=1